MKPCPFCGVTQAPGGPTFLEPIGVGSTTPWKSPNARECAAVNCWSCGAHGPTASANDLDVAKAAAVAKWDDRAPAMKKGGAA